MTTFKPEYKGGDGHAPVCVLITNASKRTMLYDFRFVTDAFGQPMRAYGYQTSVLSTYQKARNSPEASIIKAAVAPLSTSLAKVILKTAYYMGSASFKKLRSQSGEHRAGPEGKVTDHRVGAIPSGTSLYVELGSIPVDGRLDNKGWALTTDTTRYIGSCIGPALLDGDELDAALESEPENMLASLREEGVGVAFWGETTGFWSGLGGDFFNANVNFRQLHENASFETVSDTSTMHHVQVGNMVYLLDGGGFMPPLLDFIQITVHGG
jgi:hypothetical protein